jgi:predicted helicase
LASTATWSDLLRKFPKLQLPDGAKPDDPFVCVLDPATGTGTFLFTCIEVIERTMKEKWCRELGLKSWNEPEILKRWREYVPKWLLPRLYGYELMMAPYAIAHLKLALKLGETGYQFRDGDRLHIYLTNSLEPPSEHADPRLAHLFATLAKEAQEVSNVKRRKRFTVVIGNPPYSGNSANNGEWISNLVQDYYQVDGTGLGERNPKWLQDDYVKFVRSGQFICSQSPLAVFGFITNHGYIDNPTFRGMRQSLLTDFRELWVLDLHGNIKKKETTADGGLDENVFDIQQGVAILLATRGTKNALGLKQSDVFGTRSEKYAKLSRDSAKTIAWRQVTAVSPFYVFLPQNEEVRTEYLRYPSIKQAMPVNVLGFQTHRDGFAVAFDRETILCRCEALRDSHLKDAEIKAQFEVSDNRDWNVHDARKAIREDPKWKRHAIRCLYRPFDIRWCYFCTVAMDYPRRELLDHVAGKENLCLLVPRQISFLP